MKNILGTTEDLELYNKKRKKVYEFYTNSKGYSLQATYDKNGNELTYKDSNGYSSEKTYDQNGNELTFKNSNGATKGFYIPEYTMKNPIKDNRIVKDKTFALRLLTFALDTNTSDACSEDEKQSIISYSTSLLKYQLETATEKDEIDYLIRCNAKQKLDKALKFLN